jgi:hypothetical protein
MSDDSIQVKHAPKEQLSCPFDWDALDAGVECETANGMREVIADETLRQKLFDAVRNLIAADVRAKARNELLHQILGGGSVDDTGSASDIGDRALAIAHNERWHDHNGERLTLEIVRLKIFNKKTGRFGVDTSVASKRLADLTAQLGAKK